MTYQVDGFINDNIKCVLILKAEKMGLVVNFAEMGASTFLEFSKKTRGG